MDFSCFNLEQRTKKVPNCLFWKQHKIVLILSSPLNLLEYRKIFILRKNLLMFFHLWGFLGCSIFRLFLRWNPILDITRENKKKVIVKPPVYIVNTKLLVWFFCAFYDNKKYLPVVFQHIYNPYLMQLRWTKVISI